MVERDSSPARMAAGAAGGDGERQGVRVRQLRLVGPSEDGAYLVVESPTGDRFRLPIDERLRAACRGDLSRLGQLEIDNGSLRPREIQFRVRAGESAEQVAASAGVALERVLRFAYPVLQERERVVAHARETRIRRPGAPPAETLDELVNERLVGRGTDAGSLSWDAWRREDGTWTVCLRWHGVRDYSASWTFELATRTLQADDPAAEQLIAAEFHLRTITPVTPLAAAASQLGPDPAAHPPGPPARPMQAVPSGQPGQPAAEPPVSEPRHRHPAGGPGRPSGPSGSGGPNGPSDSGGPGRPGSPNDPGGPGSPNDPGGPGGPGGPGDRGGPGWPDASARTPRAVPGRPTGSTETARPSRPTGRSETAPEAPSGTASEPAAGLADEARSTGQPGRPKPASGRAGTARPTGWAGRSGSAADRSDGPDRAGGGDEAAGADRADDEDGSGPVPIAGQTALPLPDLTGRAHPAELEPDEQDVDEDGEPARRAHVPSWDDILLGVRRRH